MIRNSKKFLTALLAASVIVTGLGGCSNKAKPTGATLEKIDKAPITLKFFDKNTGDAFTDDIAKQITKKTGVILEIQQPTGNPLEKLNLMLASDDFPDMVLMDRSNDIVNKFIAAKAVIPLNDLISKYGQNIVKMYGDTLMKTKNADGKNYYLSNWYGKDMEPVFGMLMRKDMLKEVAGDKSENGQPFTTDELEGLLKSVQEKHATVGEHKLIPMTFWAENMNAVLSTFKGMWGLKTYYDNAGELKYDVRNPKYLEMLKYINKLQREGLLDNEWAANKKQLWEQKLSNGYTFATPAAYWDAGAANDILKKNNPNSQLFAYKVVAPGVDPSKTTFGPRSSLGWDAIAITKSCKETERAIKFMDYISSEEGQ